MQTLSSDVAPVSPAFFLTPLRAAFRLTSAELPVALGIRALMAQIEKDEILFDVRSIPSIRRAGIGEPI